MNSKHVFLDSKKRGKVNRLVQTFSTCSFLAPVSPGRVPPVDPKRAAPPDSSQLCSSKDSPSPSCSVLTRTSRLPSLSCPHGTPSSSPLLAHSSPLANCTKYLSLSASFLQADLVLIFLQMFFIFRCQCCSSLAAIAAAETWLLHLANVPKRDCYHPSNRRTCDHRWTG